MSITVADDVAGALVACGVQRVYMADNGGVVGWKKSMQRREALRCILLPDAAAAAFAAAGEAQFTGKAAACCGGGECEHLSMAQGVYEAAQSAVPVVALAPQRSCGCFAGSDGESPAARALRTCAGYSTVVHAPSRSGVAVAAAVQHAVAGRTSAVVLLPEVAGEAPSIGAAKTSYVPIGPAAVAEPNAEAVARLAELVNSSSRVAFLCGRGCEAARDAVLALARRIGAPIAYTLRAKDIMEKDNPFAVGIAGPLGWGDAPALIRVAELLVIWGADFPYAEALPTHGRVVQVDADATALGRHVRLCHAVHGDVGRTAALLLPLLQGNRSDDFLTRSLMRHGRAVYEQELHLRAVNEREPLRPEFLMRLISTQAEPDAVFVAEPGYPLIWAARYLQCFGKRRLLGAFRYGASGCALAMALGVKAVQPSRQVIALCSPESLPQLAAMAQVLLREQLSVKVFVYNQTPGEAAARQDVAAVAHSAGMEAERLIGAAEAVAAVRRWLAAREPALLDAVTDANAIPQPPDTPMLRVLSHQNEGMTVINLPSAPKTRYN